ncbi:ABC transporter ATP-binding protein [Neorhizobium galegae]|uniref:ABC transporter ATP-binding protein n=1 Tax=Neorhizobium galegae TaxID=399 RepID=UPI000621054C|nr:ABC transporter ATP-binding protein [Neorhizobium galegae]CDZ27908.1 Glutathione ABC transporter, ATP-binding protein GsiA [Neorhizobium galegae bv. officinalis]KAB1111260.1 ABC transporter ATP-binding protein [Neorhizobium galegae]MCM2498871.1 ABC transporter ATP-binding protein [Neorhizobium galegae]MCQ1766874.1 ABC transporter ATP-binding protein [Neorhizobium galegae]MCQ1774861.1 ABC transporter ATP-binding protein [Neorhizobium galegae]
MTDILSITPRPSMAAGKTLLEVKNLVTEFPLRTGIFKAVNDISFSIEPGKTLCVVGESGSGKSVTARSILQIIDSPGRIASGSIILNRQDGSSVDLARLDPRSKAIRAVRGRDIAMIFQEPMSSLSPVHTVGDQITEVLRLHLNMSKAQARKEAAELLRQVEIPNPEQALDRYAFQYSGGMRQRAMIAMALACKPQLLIADEPTTALDVTTQAEILDLIKRLQQTTGMAVLFITHDMGVVAQIADDVLVMHHGVIKEYGPVDQIFHTPQDAYTKMLIGSVLKLEQKAEIRLARPPLDTTAEPILDIRNLSMHFGEMKALNDVSIALLPGETLGIVGESGSGKTTLGRSIMRLYDPVSGEMHYRRADGKVVDLARLEGSELKAARRELRMVFQDPFGSLNPRMTVAQVIGEPLLVNGLSKGKELDERVCHLMDQVGLDPAGRERYPHAFSGGQRQRIGIARAITLNPRIIVADEATSALDVSVRFQVLDLLMRLQDELQLAYIFISHDIGVIRYMCDRVGVMYRGKLVEVGEAEKVCNNPDHAYTQALISAIPRPDPRDRDRSKRFRYIEPSPHIDPSNVKNRSSAR